MKKILALIAFLIFTPQSYAYQDYTTCTEADPSNQITETADTITYTNLNKNAKTYLYKDMGAGHFSANFYHFVQFKETSYSTSLWFAPWAISNSVGCLSDIFGASGDYIMVRVLYTDANKSIFIQECNNGSATTSSDIKGLSTGTDYYLLIYRDESVGTYGTAYLKVFSDAAMTTQVGSTASVALTEKQDFRYLYGINTYYSNNNWYGSGYVKNLSISSAISGVLKTKSNDNSGADHYYFLFNPATGNVLHAGQAAQDGTYSYGTVPDITTIYHGAILDVNGSDSPTFLGPFKGALQ